MLKFALVVVWLSTSLVVGIPGPIEIEDEDYDFDQEEDLCLTSEDSKDPQTDCVFPFTHDNFTYHGCPTDHEDKTKRWCSTKTDEHGVHITGIDAWGYCTTGCNPEIFEDELLISTDASPDIQTKICDYTACNGLTYKLNFFDKVATYGQCQFPAGVDRANDDFFCFVNSDSACKDKASYGDEEKGLFLTTLACKDPKAPLPRSASFATPAQHNFGTAIFGYAVRAGRYRYKQGQRRQNSSGGRRRQCGWKYTRRGRVWRCSNRRG